ncbi:copper amine oxidase [Alteribacter lacisalsi]|uniref:Copper amine oxidase n=1 Tax=Alteribacter lacisalsi TaxID=2045244 RepID=A0A2W0HSA7_9BACI|nr:copper amine oxidase [Alteribacter lacisalsi]PYZ96458.1 copper amine oxidase [Alteribacter lacisalsi]
MFKKKTKGIAAAAMAGMLLVPGTTLAHDHSDDDHDNGDGYGYDEYAPQVSTPASDLRTHLDHLLSEHYVITVAFMQKAFDGSDDAGEVGAALDENTAELTAAIESVYGEEGAAEFERIWQSHIDFFGDLTVATAEGDMEAREQAEMDLDNYVEEFAAFLDAATEGGLPAEAGEENVAGHVEDVKSVFDAYVDGEFEEAYHGIRHGIHHMFDIGEALSGAIVEQMPEEFDHTEVSTPAADLRAALNHLMAEHFSFAVLEMQKGFDGSEDFDFAGWALDENTSDLTAAMGSIYGNDGAAAFEPIWQSHIDFFGDMVVATVEGDMEAREQAEMDLAAYVVEFAGFLDEATEGRIPAEAGEENVSSHVADVTNTFDAYVDEDYTMTYDNFRHGYHHMFALGETLSGAFVDQFPEEFKDDGEMPEEMPQTGMGGGAGSNSNMMLWITISALLAASAAVYLRKRAVQA